MDNGRAVSRGEIKIADPHENVSVESLYLTNTYARVRLLRVATVIRSNITFVRASHVMHLDSHYRYTCSTSFRGLILILSSIV